MPLSSLSEKVLGGGTPSKTNELYWNGSIPWASVGDISQSTLGVTKTRSHITQLALDKNKTKLAKRGMLLAAVRIAPGLVRVVEQDMAFNQDLKAIALKSEVNPYFVAYYFQTIKLNSVGTIVKSISTNDLLRTLVPVPPLEEQERIVNILDKFEALVNDLTSGLPAEIEARRQQYEYYRDQLLDFPELKA